MIKISMRIEETCCYLKVHGSQEGDHERGSENKTVVSLSELQYNKQPLASSIASIAYVGSSFGLNDRSNIQKSQDRPLSMNDVGLQSNLLTSLRSTKIFVRSEERLSSLDEIAAREDEKRAPSMGLIEAVEEEVSLSRDFTPAAKEKYDKDCFTVDKENQEPNTEKNIDIKTSTKSIRDSQKIREIGRQQSLQDFKQGNPSSRLEIDGKVGFNPNCQEKVKAQAKARFARNLVDLVSKRQNDNTDMGNDIDLDVDDWWR